VGGAVAAAHDDRDRDDRDRDDHDHDGARVGEHAGDGEHTGVGAQAGEEPVHAGEEPAHSGDAYAGAHSAQGGSEQTERVSPLETSPAATRESNGSNGSTEPPAATTSGDGVDTGRVSDDEGTERHRTVADKIMGRGPSENA
jgi:hypothetical protein